MTGELVGPCSVCGKPATESCSLCGALVCSRHIASEGFCSRCAQGKRMATFK